MIDRVHAKQPTVDHLLQAAQTTYSSANAELVAYVKELVAQVRALTMYRDRPRRCRLTLPPGVRLYGPAACTTEGDKICAGFVLYSLPYTPFHLEPVLP
ncbi:unnamed protein product [Echinostoma caproni]|uniref:Transposase n=1 Tax=Echinostoma caproni TaxID=27848 RepID=A0A183AW37_9TREM|nr:unnamed protein product [Echinostoma caproni]